jgi:hypothetical protein
LRLPPASAATAAEAPPHPNPMRAMRKKTAWASFKFCLMILLRNRCEGAYSVCQKSLLQKCLSTAILLIYPRESGSTGFRACADKGLNLSDMMFIFFIKMIFEPEAC